MTEVGAESWFVDVLRRAALSGHLTLLARVQPGAARGLLRAAAKYRADYTRMMEAGALDLAEQRPLPSTRQAGEAC